MGDMGVLKVSLSEASLSAHDLVEPSFADLKPESALKLSVKDTGKGMSADAISRIFEPYFTTNEVGKGTGLGLAVVHGIVKRHRWWNPCRKRVERGSVFDVFIPAAQEEVQPEADHSRVPPRGIGRILLVDDEAMIAEMSARMLEQLGYGDFREDQPKGSS